jgi:hypothetical protein
MTQSNIPFPMPDDPPPPQPAQGESRARQIFLSASPVTQTLIRSVLAEEREVQHLLRRPEIHRNILEHVKQEVK